MLSEHFGRGRGNLALSKVAIPYDTSKDFCILIVLQFEIPLIPVLRVFYSNLTRSGASWDRFWGVFDLPLGGTGLPKLEFWITWRSTQCFGSPFQAFRLVLGVSGAAL